LSKAKSDNSSKELSAFVALKQVYPTGGVSFLRGRFPLAVEISTDFVGTIRSIRISHISLLSINTFAN